LLIFLYFLFFYFFAHADLAGCRAAITCLPYTSSMSVSASSSRVLWTGLPNGATAPDMLLLLLLLLLLPVVLLLLPDGAKRVTKCSVLAR
jgi:hypothetical protein